MNKTIPQPDPAHIEHLMDTAISAYKQGNLEEAFHHAFIAAEEGDTDASFLVGTWYLEGSGVKKSIDLGRIWIQRAANMDKPSHQALHCLGHAYRSVTILKKQDAMLPKHIRNNIALNYFLKAIEHGSLKASHELLTWLLNDHQVKDQSITLYKALLLIEQCTEFEDEKLLNMARQRSANNPAVFH